MRVLISGAGVAGPACAYWFGAYGAEVTVVEVAPALRASGFAVDFRGPTHMSVLSAMGVLDELRSVATHSGAMAFVDESGRQVAELPVEFAGGDLEVYRRDLSRVLYERSAKRATYLFGDTITAMTERHDGVHVEFAHAPAATFDLVVGADGLHSTVRRLAFGPEQRYVKHLGYHIAGWGMRNTVGADATATQYGVPGRMASITADQREPGRATALTVFASAPAGAQTPAAQKELITRTFAGLGWHVPALLAGLAEADELYFDTISRVHVPEFSAGRAVLLGDAAWGVTLGGMGVGTGIVGAYVLAGEIATGGLEAGLAGYQQRMRAYAARWQRGASPGAFLAPRTPAGLWLRNRMFANRTVKWAMIRSTKTLATDAGLPDYPGRYATTANRNPS